MGDSVERARAVLLATFLVTTVALLSWAVLGASVREDAQSAFADQHSAWAGRICATYKAAHGVALELRGFGPVTAGAVTAEAHLFRVSAHPWDRLPASHVVAQCTFGPPIDVVNPSTPTTRCANGDIIVLPKLLQVIADGSGRSSPDRATETVAGLNPCKLGSHA
jgi:hypothetical protein